MIVIQPDTKKIKKNCIEKGVKFNMTKVRWEYERSLTICKSTYVHVHSTSKLTHKQFTFSWWLYLIYANNPGSKGTNSYISANCFAYKLKYTDNNSVCAMLQIN